MEYSGAARVTNKDGSQALRGNRLRDLLSHMLSIVVGDTRAKAYSFHSFRVYLACALLMYFIKKLP